MTSTENDDFKESFQLNEKENKRSIIEEHKSQQKCC